MNYATHDNIADEFQPGFFFSHAAWLWSPAKHLRDLGAAGAKIATLKKLGRRRRAPLASRVDFGGAGGAAGHFSASKARPERAKLLKAKKKRGIF